MLARCRLKRLFAVLPDHKPRPPRDRGNLVRDTRGKSPLQVIDQLLETLSVLLVNARQLPETARTFDVSAGIRADACPDQTQNGVRPAVIRLRSARTSGVIGSSSGPVHVCLSQLGFGV